MPAKNRLSIYLIKENFTHEYEIVKYYSYKESISDIGTLYVVNSSDKTPDWVHTFFGDHINLTGVFTANARALFLVKAKIDSGQTERIFALTMGYGRNMLCDDVIEEQFGLKVVLNTIKPSSLRRIGKINIGGNQKISSEQLPLKSDINEFGFDISRDIVSSIAGESDDTQYTTGILAGSDILVLSASVNISNIREFLVKTYQKYCLTTYRQNFGWIDQIQFIKDTHLLEALNKEMLRQINEPSDNFWMAVPEIINWEEISGFQYAGGIYDDIKIEIVINKSFRNPLVSIDQLKSKRIYVIDAVSDAPRRSWSAYHCLYGELEYQGHSYCINSGKWYRVSKDFHDQIIEDYARTKISSIEFDDCPASIKYEKDYNSTFQKKHSTTFILLDSEIIVYGGGYSKVELCDLLSKDAELIHIKPYSGSSTLSHLFNQATVSAELLLSDASFRDKANKKIKTQTDDDSFIIDDPHNIKIVFGIISKHTLDLPNIPFFSKVTFRYAKNRLRAFGLDISIKTIHKS